MTGRLLLLPPSKSRRGIHTLISVAMLIGFTLAGASLLLFVLSEHADIAMRDAGCMVSDVSVYRTGPGLAYVTAVLHNTGSVPMRHVSIAFVGDAGGSGGAEIASLDTELGPGQNLDIMSPFSAPFLGGGSGDPGAAATVSAAATFEDGSKIGCIT